MQFKNKFIKGNVYLDYSPNHTKSHRKVELSTFLWDSLYYLSNEHNILEIFTTEFGEIRSREINEYILIKPFLT